MILFFDTGGFRLGVKSREIPGFGLVKALHLGWVHVYQLPEEPIRDKLLYALSPKFARPVDAGGDL